MYVTVFLLHLNKLYALLYRGTTSGFICPAAFSQVTSGQADLQTTKGFVDLVFYRLNTLHVDSSIPS